MNFLMTSCDLLEIFEGEMLIMTYTATLLLRYILILVTVIECSANGKKGPK